MAFIGIQEVDGKVAVSISRGGVPIEDLLFVPRADKGVMTDAEDLLHDGSKIAMTIRLRPRDARELARLLILEAGNND